jgi:hypothetical protein
MIITRAILNQKSQRTSIRVERVGEKCLGPNLSRIISYATKGAKI